MGLSWGSDTGVSLRALGWVSGQTVSGLRKWQILGLTLGAT